MYYVYVVYKQEEKQQIMINKSQSFANLFIE